MMMIIPFDQAISPKKVSNYFQKGRHTAPNPKPYTQLGVQTWSLVTLASSGGLAKGFIKNCQQLNGRQNHLDFCELNPTKAQKW
jgi:hypothetical protein